MILLLTSFLAGVLSILAPCILPMIPILLARSASSGHQQRSPWWVIGGLAGSIFVFSILLKSTTLLIDVDQAIWAFISGAIIIIVGVSMALPHVWEHVSERLNLSAQKGLGEAQSHRGVWGDVMLGVALGPVFSACSPTYLLIVATILPVDPLEGLVYLISFIAGLVLALVAVVVFGSRLVRKLGWGLNPDGWFRRGAGILLIAIGVMIITGLDKDILAWFVTNGWFDWQVSLENELIVE